jgi:hypothetical protein
MKNKIIAFAFAVVFMAFLASSASADLFWNYDVFVPPDGFSVSNGTIINFSAELDANGSTSINGTLCITVNTATGLGACGTVTGGSLAGIEVFFPPYYYNYPIGSYFWRANYTSNESVILYSNSRNWNLILTQQTIIPIYPISNINVTGDNTNNVVNYTVDVYLPEEIISNRYFYFYAYSSYLGTPSFDSQTLICEKVLTANTTNPLSSGYYRIGCENYMYDNFNLFYEELPINPKYWRVKGRFIEGEIDGANLFADTGFQQYNYLLQAPFQQVFPLDNMVFCDSTTFYLVSLQNVTLINIKPICFNGKGYHNQFINFNSYLDTQIPTMCGNGNLSWIYYNANNVSQAGRADYLGISANTSLYWQADILIPTGFTNTTYYGWSSPLTAIQLVSRWTYTCPNGTIYNTDNHNIWYIIGIGISGANITAYPTYPLPINSTYLFPTLATYWASFFNTTTQGGLIMFAILFLIMIAILVLINMEVIAGVNVFVYGMLVFARLGYLPIELMWIMLIISGLTLVYFVRKFLLRRN